MGKPYAAELNRLTDTYAWCTEASVDALATSVRSLARLPLLAVGSGGSLTSAHFAAFLHTHYTGKLARTMTPYELRSSPLFLGDVGVLLLSAGGSNPDVLSAFNQAALRTPGHIGFLCTRKGSPLAEAASPYPWIHSLEFEAPVEKDGFLATNSLIGATTLLARAYHHNWHSDEQLPSSFDELLHPGRTRDEFLDKLRCDCQTLWERQTLLVLHGYTTHPGAIDLESKFTEAALGNLQLADYRNFAHGRHHWLARHGLTSAVLALVTPHDTVIAARTLALLPEETPVVRLDFPEGVGGALACVAVSIYLAGLAGVASGVDPGRPHVPTFGRKLYHLNPKPIDFLKDRDLSETEAAAVERKAGMSVMTLFAQGRLTEWRNAYVRFRTRLRGASFRAVVFDYDGTLCGSAERYTGPREEVSEQLLRLLRAGLYVGIATGRGKSVRKDLRKRIHDPSLRRHVILGYHNCTEIGFLDDESQPPLDGNLDSALAEVVQAFDGNSRLSNYVRLEARNRQVTLELIQLEAVDEVWEMVERVVREHAPPGVTAVRSSHSIDLLAPGVTKRDLVKKIRDAILNDKGGGDVLCVGDRGRWPGNDFALLQEIYSLSVDEVSADPETCWNLAQPGSRHVEACLEYLAGIETKGARATLSL